MSIRSSITILAFLLCCSVSAQNVPDRAAKRAKQRAENKAQNKVDRSVDKAVDDAFNSIGNLFKKKKKKPAPAPSGSETTTTGDTKKSEQTNEEAGASGGGLFGGMLGGGKDWEPYTNPMTFSITMEVEEAKRSGKVDKSNIRLGVTSDRFAIRISDDAGKENSHMILNTQDGMTTMITTDKKGERTGVRLRIPNMGSTVTETGEATLDRYTFEKTGERKMVDGYNCEKVIVTDTQKGTVTESWVTQDLDITSAEIFGGMAQAFGGKAPQARGGTAQAPFEGFPIMSTTVENGKTYITRFRDIKIGEGNMDRSLLDTSGVEIQSLGF
jgi:hypothetical protein